MALNILNKMDFSATDEDKKEISKLTKEFVDCLKATIKRKKINGDVFVGGSFAKGTMAKSENYDVDIFIRFDKKDDKTISELLQKIIKELKLREKINILHGSRDYIQIEKSPKVTFEIIPTIKVSKAKDARNTTDLSYFHVKYAKDRINSKIAREICIAKQFFKAAKVYGAESYVNGFSGYSVECLLIYYKSFEKMIKSFLSAKDKIIIDPENYYKKQNILIEINESKAHGPIILVDPTFKERNVLAALSQETFDKLNNTIKAFLSKPDIGYFEVKEIDIDKLKQDAKNKKAEFIQIMLTTDKQEGDIAGTKMKKFAKHLIAQIEPQFKIIREEFDYKLGKTASLYIIAKSNGEVERVGPPIKLKQACEKFKKVYPNAKVKAGSLVIKIPVRLSAKDFVINWIKNNQKKIKDMDISEIDVC
jgi:tRNA nucleotidyltransferase (CCA-adding enzyme)